MLVLYICESIQSRKEAGFRAKIWRPPSVVKARRGHFPRLPGEAARRSLCSGTRTITTGGLGMEEKGRCFVPDRQGTGGLLRKRGKKRELYQGPKRGRSPDLRPGNATRLSWAKKGGGKKDWIRGGCREASTIGPRKGRLAMPKGKGRCRSPAPGQRRGIVAEKSS